MNLFPRPTYRSCATVCTLAFVLLFTVATLRHLDLASSAYDLGIFYQALYSAAHGGALSSSLRQGIHLLRDHVSPILYLWVPGVALFQDPIFLLFTQSLFLAAGGFLVLALTRQADPKSRLALRNWIPLLLYFFHPALHAANRFDFHPECISPILFLGAVWGLQSQNRNALVAGVTSLLLFLGVKESAGPVAFGLGLAWFFGAGVAETRSRTRKWGPAVALIGLLVFIFDVMIFPRIGSTHYMYASHFSAWASPGWELLRERFGNLARWKFVFVQLGGFALLPLMALATSEHKGAAARLIPAAIGFLILFASDGTLRFNPEFHYGLEVLPALSWASASAIPLIRWSKPAVRFATAVGLISFIATYLQSDLQWVFHYWPKPQAQSLRADFFPRVNSAVSWVAPANWVPHLIRGQWINLPPELIRRDGQGPIDCIITAPDRSNHWPMDGTTLRAWISSLPDQGYQVEWSCEDIQVWARSPSVKCLTSRPPESVCLTSETQ
jgi:hypothetical protein